MILIKLGFVVFNISELYQTAIVKMAILQQLQHTSHAVGALNAVVAVVCIRNN